MVDRDRPEWMTDRGFATLQRGYLIESETPRDMYRRLARSAAQYVGKKYEDKFFEYMWKGWLCPASPVLSNLGSPRGLPISCFGLSPADSVDSIFAKAHEQAMLAKHGGGVGIDLSNIRCRNTPITGNGVSEGVVPWSKVYDVTTVAVSQGNVRRGASSLNLPVDHGDVREFLRIRKPEGDHNRQCLNSHQCVMLTDAFMVEVRDGNPDARALWLEILRTRLETGEPYLMFSDTVNRANPQNHPKVTFTNICCLSGDTLVLTSDGPAPIASLVGKSVTIFDGEAWVQNSNFEQKDDAPLWTITLADGSEIQATANHRWFAAQHYNDVRYSKFSEVLTEDLKPGMFLEAHSEEVPRPNRIQTGWRRVVSIAESEVAQPTYCTTVPTTGKFALASGLMTGNSEINLHADADHTFVCCLSSLNVARYDEWKDTDLVETSILFLEAVMSEFIERAATTPGFECAVRFSEKSRALGLGVLGWHTLLQQRELPFDATEAMALNLEVFKLIDERAKAASKKLGAELGSPVWAPDGQRHSHLTAIAPTATNSIIAGDVSPGIEPSRANVISLKTAKGTFIVKNHLLKQRLETLGKDTPEVWASIAQNEGSVFHLSFLDEHTKRVFATAPEINQFVLIRQAAQRQRFVCQSQSLNLFFPANVDPKFFNKVHLEAWESGVKTLYYVRSGSVLRADVAKRALAEDCAACEG